MVYILKIASAALLGLLPIVVAQYITPTAPVWQQGISQIEKGNGAFLSPDGRLLAVVSKDATVRTFNPLTGVPGWVYTPTDVQSSSTFGGAFFCNYDGQPYVLISVTTNAIFAEMASSTLVALDSSTGAVLYTTPTLAGVTKGTPLCTEDGSIILATHNEDAERGHFSVFNYGGATVNYTFAAPSSGNASYPFGAVGYYYNPAEGNYPQGAGNTNDLFMWVADVPGSASEAGAGQMFAFQVPVVLPFNSTPFSAYEVGNVTTFQSPNPPVFADQGYIMYQANTKSEIRYWQGDGLPRNFFQATAQESLGFDRGLPRFAAAGAPPTLSSNDATPDVYGPTAANQIYKMPFDFSSFETVNISSPLTNKVLLSPDDLYLYYGTADSSLFQIDTTTLAVTWNITTSGAISGEMAQSLDGVYIYVPDSAGMLSAYQVKNKTTGESIFPSATPTEKTTVAPTVLVLSDAPTPGSSDVTTVVGSEMTALPTPTPVAVDIPTAPVPAPVAAAPVASPVAAPVRAPAPSPTPASAASSMARTSFIGILVVVLFAIL